MQYILCTQYYCRNIQKVTIHLVPVILWSCIPLYLPRCLHLFNEPSFLYVLYHAGKLLLSYASDYENSKKKMLLRYALTEYDQYSIIKSLYALVCIKYLCIKHLCIKHLCIKHLCIKHLCINHLLCVHPSQAVCVGLIVLVVEIVTSRQSFTFYLFLNCYDENCFHTSSSITEAYSVNTIHSVLWIKLLLLQQQNCALFDYSI